MREFILTSPVMEGALIFGYDDQDRLIKFENKAKLNYLQLQAVYDPERFPFTFDKLSYLKGKTGRIEEIQDITWDRFWTDYNYKKGKIKAEIEWNKLKSDEQAKAIAKIPSYKYFCSIHNHEVLYPERYLKYKRYNDE
jgi:hypothetical protein